MKKLICALVTLFMLNGCATGGSGTGGGGLNSGATSVDANTGEAFSDLQKVVIGGFAVGFDTFKTESVKAGGGLLGSGFGGKSTAKSTLTGVDEATMQAITDAAYKDFVRSLREAGYDVVNRKTLLQHESFKDTNTLGNPIKISEGGMLGGGNETLYFAPSSFGGIKPFAGDIPGEVGGYGWSNPSSGAGKFATETSLPVLHIVYNVDFANSESYGGWHTSTSAINVEQGITVTPGRSRMEIIGGQGGTFSSDIGSLALSSPISSDKKFAEIKDATSDTSKAVETVTNVIGTLGGVGSNKSRRFEFAANEKAYKEATLKALENTNALFLKEMQARR